MTDRLAQNQAEALTKFSADAPLNQTINDSIGAGYQIPPSMVKPTFLNNIIESVSGKQATQQLASTHNNEVTQGLARTALGLEPGAPLTQDSLSAYRAGQYKAGYEPIKSIGTISTDQAFNDAINDVAAKYTGKGTIPAIQKKAVEDLAQAHKSNGFDASDAVDAIKVLREDAKDAYKKGDTSMGGANRSIADAYENLLDRTLGKPGTEDLLQNYQDARQNIAKSFTVEAGLREGSGTVDARKIGALMQKGAPLTDELQTIGQFGNVYPSIAKTPEQIGSPATHNLKAALAPVMALAGSHFGGPVGIAAGAVPFIAPPVARALMFRQAAQRGLISAEPEASGLGPAFGLLADQNLQRTGARILPATAGLLSQHD